MAARILEGNCLRFLLGRGLCGGPQIGIINKFPKAAQPRFSPISGSFFFLGSGFVFIFFGSGLGLGLGLGLRLGCGLGLRLLLSDQDVLSARKREQPTTRTIRAANLLGELLR